MGSRIIKFKVFLDGKIIGYERLTEKGWQWMSPDLNPDDGSERWSTGVFAPGYDYKRFMWTGLQDKNGKDAYEKDYDEDGNMIDFCERCSGYQFFQIDIPSKDIIHCHNCEGNFMLQDHIGDFKIISHLFHS